MEDNFEDIKPKIEYESDINQTRSNTCDEPNGVDNDSAIIKTEPDSNCEDDGGDSKSVTKTIEETSKERTSCETEDGRIQTRLRSRMTRLGTSKRETARISYCEDTSSADSENEYLPPKRKRTRASDRRKTSKGQSKNAGNSKLNGQEPAEMIHSCVPKVKSEPSSETDEVSIPEWSTKKLNQVKVIKNKRKLVTKRSNKKMGVKGITTFQEVCDIFHANYHKKHFYRGNPEIIAACRKVCKKYLIYRCKICMSDSDNMDCAKDHFDKKHSADPKSSKDKDKFVEYFKELYKCDQCGFTTLYIRNLVKHVDSLHSHDKQQVLHSCDKCNFTTFDKYRFSSHVDNHLGPEKQKTECHFCHLSFVLIKKHLQTMHAENTSEIKCPQCLSTFGNVRNMRRHLKYVHSPSGMNFVCTECGKVFEKESNLVRHTRRIHYQTGKRFECKLCSSKIKTKCNFNRHMLRHRVDVKSLLYACADCEKSFNFKHSLQNHIRREHDKTCEGLEKNHLCEICGKSFERKEALDRHMVVHTKEKKFVCAICNKGFTQMDSLKSHQVVHTGIKPFECEKCGNKYSQKYPLTQHIKKHYPD